MRRDRGEYDAVDAIGFHYRTSATEDYIRMADVDDKEVWYSEGCATFGYSELQENKTTEYGAGTIGGYQSPLALLDSFPTAFVGSRRTQCTCSSRPSASSMKASSTAITKACSMPQVRTASATALTAWLIPTEPSMWACSTPRPGSKMERPV